MRHGDFTCVLLCPAPGRGHSAFLAVVCLSVRLSVPYLTSSRERKCLGSWNWQEGNLCHGWPVTLYWLQDERLNTCRGGGCHGAEQLVCFTGTLMSNGRLVYYDLPAERSAWLFKSPRAWGRRILLRPRYRSHSLLRWIFFARQIGGLAATSCVSPRLTALPTEAKHLIVDQCWLSI